MRLVIQRVTEARVEIDGRVCGSIQTGLLALVGVAKTDTRADGAYLAEKLIHLRIFRDESGRMNRSVIEAGGGLLVVSNFTLYGDCGKGRRPSFDLAAGPEQARSLYEDFLANLRGRGIAVETGVFQAMMEIHLVNDGPVTFVIDSKAE